MISGHFFAIRSLDIKIANSKFLSSSSRSSFLKWNSQRAMERDVNNCKKITHERVAYRFFRSSSDDSSEDSDSEDDSSELELSVVERMYYF